jgi:predicted nucleotidyltransferase
MPAITFSTNTKERASGFTPDFWKKGSLIIAQSNMVNQKKNTIQLMAPKIRKPVSNGQYYFVSPLKTLHLNMHLEKPQIDKIQELCKANRVKSLFAFGSVTRDDFNTTSDIDLLVDFDENDPFEYTDLYFNLKQKLEEILKRQVDLLEERGIRNRFFKEQLEKSKVKLYGY